RFDRLFEEQISQDLATIEKVYREETGDLGELAQRMRTTLFEVVEGQTVIYRTAGWPPAGRTPYRIRTAADATHRITVARDETPLRQTLWTLAVILAVAPLHGRRLPRASRAAHRHAQRRRGGPSAVTHGPGGSRGHRQHAGGCRSAHAARGKPAAAHAGRCRPNSPDADPRGPARAGRGRGR